MSIIINAKWNGLAYIVVLRIIKSRIYYYIRSIVHNSIAQLFIIIVVGLVISYLWRKFIWDKYFIDSPPIFNLLDRPIIDDIAKITFFFFPSINVTPEFPGARGSCICTRRVICYYPFTI